MKQYNVNGMSCAACSTRVEKAVSKVEGVTSCSVSLLTNSMGVEGDAKEADILAAVEKAGYSASVKGENTAKPAEHAEEEFLKDKETPVLKKRLILSFCFLVPLMYLSMGHMMWNWPLPGILAENHVAMGILQLLLTGCVMIDRFVPVVGNAIPMPSSSPVLHSHLNAYGSFSVLKRT